MKGTTIIISALFIMLGLGIKTVISKSQETLYNCTVLTVDVDGNQTYRTGKFTEGQLDNIKEYGGGMLGIHVTTLREQDSTYTGLVGKQEEAFSGAVGCKKI